MGGEDHGTIRVSVLEQMADAHLARVDDFTIQGTACYIALYCVGLNSFIALPFVAVLCCAAIFNVLLL